MSDRGADALDDMVMHTYSERKRRAESGQSQNPKDIAGSRKPPLHLVPPVANLWECMVLQVGADEYGAWNWRAGPKITLSEYVGAMERHIAALKDGQWNDPKHGFPHLAAIRAGAGIVLDAESLGQLNNDLPAPGKAADLIARLTREPPDEISE